LRDFTRRREVRGPARPGLTGLAAGLLWRLFLIGLMQFATLFAASRILRWIFGAPTSLKPVGGMSRRSEPAVDSPRPSTD
jgi:hypothetical protein